jgi:hypothetical protein
MPVTTLGDFRVRENRELKAVTVRVEPRIWHRFGELAREDERDASSFLRKVMADIVTKAGGSKQAAA